MFEQLKGNGRVWIYTSSRALTADELALIAHELTTFLSSWAAHGKSLKAAFELIHDRIIVLAVDEDIEQATGCSIDTASQWFAALDRQLDLDLFNRLNLAFLTDDIFELVPMHQLEQAFASGRIRRDSIFFNNSVSRLNDLRSNWKIPFEQSWAFQRIRSTQA